ncbi:hypothetical protein E8E13_005442 [Curvularia kusanoi]|uniref:Apple domain-containing protein n=1 Tax=Curvularia kusanoi TaxID=90978 RepID=A0A9P4WAJ1_CURKU|nr:hypothetical protein E8E13_005442 [Curvularia kusanoi]
MVAFGSGSLMALVWASAALATPLIAEPMQSRDLVVRADTLCPQSYTSKNGMSFTTYCNQNNPGDDAMAVFTSNSMEDCMEHCSRYWGNGEGCFGVVWREDNKCWLRNSNTTVNGVHDYTDKPMCHSALIAPNTYEKIDTACPGDNLSTHSLDGVPGLGYTLYCNKVINDYDTCWSGYPKPCWDSQHVSGHFVGFYHTKTLEECVRICTDQMPLCKGVSWNPDYSIGYANCWPKTSYSDDKIETPLPINGVIHSVAITSLETINKDCPTAKTYPSSNNNNFNINCGQTNDGTNITRIHSQNMTSCMDSCAGTDKCVGIVFDSSMQDGFKNCYLKNTTSTVSDRTSASFALLAGSSIPSSSPSPSSSSSPGSSSGTSTSDTANTPTSNDSESSPSKAWIAGAVVGPLAGLALIAGALFWWRRRKNAHRDAAAAPREKVFEIATPAGRAPAGSAQYYHPVNEADSDAARNELPGTTKYAHRSGEGELHEAP